MNRHDRFPMIRSSSPSPVDLMPQDQASEYLRGLRYDYAQPNFLGRIGEPIYLTRGSYGKIFSLSYDGNHVVIKKIPFRRNLEYMRRALTEFSIGKLLSKSRTRYLLPLRGVIRPRSYRSFDSLHLSYRKMDGSLRHLLRRVGGRPTPGLTRAILFQCLHAVRECHEVYGIVHRDIKLGNFLYSLSGAIEVKLTDFGNSMSLSDTSATWSRVFTRWYSPPELTSLEASHATEDRMINVLSRSSTYDPRTSDLWCLGCLFFELLTGGYALFPSSTPHEQLKQIIEYSVCSETFLRDKFARVCNSNDGCIDDDSLDLLISFLMIDPSKRMTASEALSHPYFDFLLDDDEDEELGVNHHREKEEDDDDDDETEGRMDVDGLGTFRFCFRARSWTSPQQIARVLHEEVMSYPFWRTTEEEEVEVDEDDLMDEDVVEEDDGRMMVD